MKRKKIDAETAACMAFESLKNQVRHEVKAELKMWYLIRFALALSPTIILIGGGLLGIWHMKEDIMKTVEKDLSIRVNKIYEEKNISILVDDLIETKASNLIREQASERIDSIIESEIRPVIIIHDLALKAQQGYKTAYFKLDSIANIEGYEYAELARDIVSEIYGNVINYVPRKLYTGKYSNEQIIQRLNEKHINVREMAVCSIGERKMYNQIPHLIAMLKTEKNLYVLAAIAYVLNQSFNSNISIFDSDSEKQFTRLWRNMQNELIDKR